MRIIFEPDKDPEVSSMGSVDPKKYKEGTYLYFNSFPIEPRWFKNTIQCHSKTDSIISVLWLPINVALVPKDLQAQALLLT